MEDKDLFIPDFDNLFPFLYNTVMRDGGDGDGFVITKYCSKERVADAFEHWLNHHHKDVGYKRWDDSPKHLGFSLDMDNFTFADKEEDLVIPDWATIVIKM